MLTFEVQILPVYFFFDTQYIYIYNYLFYIKLFYSFTFPCPFIWLSCGETENKCRLLNCDLYVL